MSPFIMIAFPWMATVIAAVFAALFFWRRSRAAGLAAVSWGAYSVYEYLMYARVLCSGECNIRVDLLLAYPALALLSLVALVGTLRRRSLP